MCSSDLETTERLAASIPTIVCWRMKRITRASTKFIRAMLFLMGATAAWHGCAYAQEFRSTLRVEVRDSSGAAIAAAKVLLTDESSGLQVKQSADSAGEINFQGISPGTYSLTVKATGFAAHTQSVVLAISGHAVVRIVLTPETLRQSVEVKDRGPSLASQPLETSSSTIQTVITANDIDEVPLSARSFANIALMAPFTAPVEPSDPTKARITAVSFGGSSGLNNRLCQ